ncbi:MAG: aldo/keto reductase [Anaerolineae bacterium]|nr:aldo/keto reductase [Anaerolineae bacterium]
MDYRQLGKNGPEIPVIGLGAWPIGGGMGRVDEDNAIRTVQASIDQGITLIDTAQYYRTSEALIGKALRGGYRERCFIATKVSGKYSRADIRAAIENSLKMLDVETVDLYQIHSWRSEYPIEDSMDEMAKLQQEGKARFLGVSNFNAAQMREALQIARFHSNQPRYNLFDREIEAEDIPFCEQEGIGILAHSPLAKGLLGGRYTPQTTFPPDDERSSFPRFQGETFARYLAVVEQLKQVAADKGISIVQLAIAWQLRLPAITCVLVGAKNPQQVADYTGAVGVTFTPEELARIETILKDKPAV